MFKSGFIGIVGRPNVGKSTHLNSILGKASYPTPNQTTRNRIIGIRHRRGTVGFLDTGIRKPQALNEAMVKTAQNVFADVDVILVLVAADAALGSEDLSLFAALKSYEQRVILGVNKADLIRKELLLPFIDAACQSFPFRACVPLCARTGEGVPALLDEILALLPEGPPYFPEDMVTDRPERFFAAEIIREKI